MSTNERTMTCVGGPLDGEKVHPLLGPSFVYCLNPLTPVPEFRTFGTYLRTDETTYAWKGTDK